MNIKELYKLYLKYPRVIIDSRQIQPSSIYFALKGERFDGNKFAYEALERGAEYAVIDNDLYGKNERCILVSNVLDTLQSLANYHRRQLTIPVIGITGTNGKTTTKELINSVLSEKYHVLATQGNLNNHIGVPLTLLSITKEHELAVIEMGANHLYEIERLCEIAQPCYGIITNIGKAHLEGFGSFEGVKKAKSELYEFVRDNNGVFFYNKDNALLESIVHYDKVCTYSFLQKANCMASVCEANPYIGIEWKNKSIQIISQLLGTYNAENILAAVCIGDYFGVEFQKIKNAIEGYLPRNNRSQFLKTANNQLFVDAYNANPTSIENALMSFREIKAAHKIVILGDMLELGEESSREHKKIVEFVQKVGFSSVFFVGELFYEFKNDFSLFNFFKTTQNLKEYIEKQSIKNRFILLKGSRKIGLEKLIDLF